LRVLGIGERRVGRIIPFGRTGEQEVDRIGNQLDVAIFLTGDVGDEVIVGPHFFPPTEVERLHGVVHERRHFAEVPAKQFLDGSGRTRGRVLRARQLNGDFVYSENHVALLV
jgi:hypothetical protein